MAFEEDDTECENDYIKVYEGLCSLVPKKYIWNWYNPSIISVGLGELWEDF